MKVIDGKIYHSCDECKGIASGAYLRALRYLKDKSEDIEGYAPSSDFGDGARWAMRQIREAIKKEWEKVERGEVA